MSRKVFTDGQVLAADDVNIIGNPFTDGVDELGHGPKVEDSWLSDSNNQIKSRFYTWFNRFKPTYTPPGLNVAIASGILDSGGVRVNLPAQNVVVPDNATTFIWIGWGENDPTIQVRTSSILPNECVKIAQVTSLAGVVTQLNDLRQPLVENLSPSTVEVPVGTCILSLLPSDSSEPTGYLEILQNPRNVLRSQYPKLFSKFGVSYGNGDGSTTFGIPGHGGRIPIFTTNLLEVGGVGGNATMALTLNNLPTHSHGITDNGHSHTTTQTPHSHGVNDPTHKHTHQDFGHFHNLRTPMGGRAEGEGLQPCNSNTNLNENFLDANVDMRTSNINIQNASTGISIQSGNADIAIAPSTTGITINNTGSGQAFSLLPPVLKFRLFIKY